MLRCPDLPCRHSSGQACVDGREGWEAAIGYDTGPVLASLPWITNLRGARCGTEIQAARHYCCPTQQWNANMDGALVRFSRYVCTEDAV